MNLNPSSFYELYGKWTNYLTSVFSAEELSYSYISEGVVMRINIKVAGLVLNNFIRMDINVIYIIIFFSFILSSYQRRSG